MRSYRSSRNIFGCFALTLTAMGGGASEDENLRGRLVGKVGVAYGTRPYLQPGCGELPSDFVGGVSVAGQRQAAAIGVGPMDALALAPLEGHQQMSLVTEHPS